MTKIAVSTMQCRAKLPQGSPLWGQLNTSFKNRELIDWAEPPLVGFKRTWDSLNAKRGYGWDSNPFVWVIEFERIQV